MVNDGCLSKSMVVCTSDGSLCYLEETTVQWRAVNEDDKEWCG